MKMSGQPEDVQVAITGTDGNNVLFHLMKMEFFTLSNLHVIMLYTRLLNWLTQYKL